MEVRLKQNILQNAVAMKKDDMNNEETTKQKPKRQKKVGNEEIELKRAI